MPINSLLYPANSAVAGGFDVANSVRLDNNAYLSRTFSETGAGAGGGTFKWTLSLWFKRSLIDGNEHVLMSRYVNANKYVTIKINGNNKIEYRVYNSANQCRMTTTAVFRDVAAWTHFVIAQDSTLSTAGDRVKFFINGSRVTVFDTQTNFNQNVGGDFNTAAPHHIGAYNGGDEFQGYFAQVCFVDNVQYDADKFGEFDEDSGIWTPIDVSDLSTGATSFLLVFKDSSALGTDSSGDNNNFSVNNITAIDQVTDTCTNNFATGNILSPYANRTITDGSLTITSTTTQWTNICSTIGVSSGKWWIELKHTAGSYGGLGIVFPFPKTENNVIGDFSAPVVQQIGYIAASGDKKINNSTSSYGSTWVGTGDIVNMSLNLDDNELKFYKNGTVQNSGTAIAISSGYTYFVGTSNYNSSGSSFNFGNPAYAISSGNADGKGYGNFEYAPPSGFLALCTKNLAESG